MPTVYARALQRAAEVLGGKEPLRALLHVTPAKLAAWLSGDQNPPMDVFLIAVDVISDADLPVERERRKQTVERSKALRRSSETLRTASLETRQRALQIKAAALAGRHAVSRRPRQPTALGFLGEKFAPGQGSALVAGALDAAIAATGADKGDLRLVRPDGLWIVAHRGFDEAYLSFFACVTGAQWACGRALTQRKRVIVADVASSALFAGTLAAPIMALAQVAALQSTPLAGVEGQVLGVLSTHYLEPHEPDQRELCIIDDIAERTAFWLDGGKL
jgi:hypothetical protein